MGTTTAPVYLRVLDDLRSRIRSGLLGPGARVPSRNAIITNYGVGETAAKHALAVLLAEGLIEARPGSGCYVRKTPAAGFLEHDRPQFPGSPFGVAEAVVAVGQRADRLQHATRKLAWEHQTEHVQPPAPIARRLNLGPGELATMTRYLLSADGEPVQLARSFEPAKLTAGSQVALPEQGPLAGRGVIERLRSIGVDVDEVTEEVGVRLSSRADAAELSIQPGSVVFVIERTHHRDGQAVEYTEIVVPADRFKLRYRYVVSETRQMSTVSETRQMSTVSETRQMSTVSETRA